MSGHSKWHNIQAKKGKADAAKGKIFTKIGREIIMAVKSGGPEPSNNAKLRDVIAKAKANNMPNDTINKSIKRATGEDSNKNYEEITYEGYGPNGVAIIIQASTDNKNRTIGDVRHVVEKSGGKIGTSGCVSYMFERKGVMVIEKGTANISEDELMLLAIDAGAEDFESGDGYYQITTTPDSFSTVRENLEKNNLVFAQAEIQMLPSNYVTLDEHGNEKMENLLEKLEDLDDVMEVYHNWDEQ